MTNEEERLWLVVRHLRAREACLLAALRPLAAIARDIDERTDGIPRPDDFTLWQANAMRRVPCDLTMRHARAARRVVEGVEGE
jgi:hypothetical protein